MLEIAALIILIVSFLGMLVIFVRKIPTLVALPTEDRTSKDSLFLKLRDRFWVTRNSHPFKSFSFEIFLQKILSRARILILKIERKIADCLQKMREKSKKEKGIGNDNYWTELKNSTNKKRKKNGMEP